MGIATVDAPVFAVGEPLTGRVISGLSVPDCLEPSATGTILDSQNDPIEGVTWKTVTTEFGLFAAEFTFTPKNDEPHFVTVRFQPNLGIVQGYVFGGTRTTRPVLDTIRVTTPGQCQQRHVSPLGTSWCATESTLFGANRDARLYSLGEGIGDRSTVFAGGSIWLTRPSGVERWIERSDGGYEREPAISLPGQRVLAATETDGFGATSDALFHFTIDDAGSWQTESWPASLEDPIDSAPLTAHADAGLWWWAGQARGVCAFPMRPDGGPTHCFPNLATFGLISATERDGFWSSDGGVAIFTRLDGTVTSLSTPGGFSPLSLLGPFAQREQLIFPAFTADAGLHWEILSEHSSGVAWIQEDRIWLSTGTELVALPRYTQ